MFRDHFGPGENLVLNGLTRHLSRTRFDDRTDKSWPIKIVSGPQYRMIHSCACAGRPYFQIKVYFQLPSLPFGRNGFSVPLVDVSFRDPSLSEKFVPISSVDGRYLSKTCFRTPVVHRLSAFI